MDREDISRDPDKYARFLQFIHNKFRSISYSIGRVVIHRVYYYDAIVPVEDDSKKHMIQKEFFNKLQLDMSMCEVKLGDLIKSGKGGFKQKGVDTLIAIDMITKAYLNHYEIAYLVAGDRDFVNVVKAVKNYTGKMVIGIYEPTSISEELLRVLDIRMPLRKDELGKICDNI